MVTPQSVDAISSGDHACLTFTDPDERLDIHVNLAPLRYIDAAFVSIILPAAAGRPPDRCMTVTCQGLVHKMFTLVDPDDDPALRVQTVHGQP